MPIDEPARDDQPIFHIALPDDWTAAYATGEYTTSSRGQTLADVGFIHASTQAQIEATAKRFYADLDQLVLLMIDPLRIDAEIRWEPPAPGMDELFPHIYGPLPIPAVVSARYWARTIDEHGSGWSLDDL